MDKITEPGRYKLYVCVNYDSGADNSDLAYSAEQSNPWHIVDTDLYISYSDLHPDFDPPTISLVSGDYNEAHTEYNYCMKAEDSSGISEFQLTGSNISNPYNGKIMANGAYQFYAKDTRGNKAYQTLNIGGIDVTPPYWTKKNFTLASDKNSATIYASIADDYTTDWVEIDGSRVSGANHSKTVTENKSYTIKAADKAGHVIQDTITVTGLDRDNPTITGKWATLNNEKTGATIRVTASDPTTSVAWIKINGVVGYTSDHSIWVTSDGTYTIQVSDTLGHITTDSIIVRGIDKTPPTASISQSVTDWTKTPYDLILSGTDANGLHSSQPYSWDGSNFSTNNRKQISNNGTYNGWTKDIAGNISSKASIVVSNFDYNPPTVNAIPNYNSERNKATYTISANDTQSGLHAQAYNFGNGWTSSNTSPEYLVNGTHTYRVRDALGNEVSKTVSIDKILGVTTLTLQPIKFQKGYPHDLKEYVTDYHATFLDNSTLDLKSGMTCSVIKVLDEASQEVTYDYATKHKGEYTITLKVTNGEYTDTKSTTMTVYDCSPIITQDMVFTDTENIKITWTNLDPSEVDHYVISIGSTTRNETSQETTVKLADFAKEVKIYAVDKQGNKSDASTFNAIPVKSVKPLTITSTKYTPYGNLPLPTEVTVITDHFEMPLQINWAGASRYNYALDTQILDGTLVLQEGLINPNSIEGKLTINLKDLTLSRNAIINFPEDEDLYPQLTCPYKCSNLSEKLIPFSVAQIYIDENTTLETPVIWDISTVDLEHLGTYIIQGEVQSIASISIEGDLHVNMKVNVVNAKPISIAATDRIYKPAYTAFEQLGLSPQLNVTYDNGETRLESIEWHKSDYDNTYIEDKQFVYGHITDFEYGYEDNPSLKPCTTVKLNKASIIGFEDCSNSDKFKITALFDTDLTNYNIPTSVKVTLDSVDENNLPVTRDIPVTFLTSNWTLDRHTLGEYFYDSNLNLSSFDIQPPDENPKLKVNNVEAHPTNYVDTYNLTNKTYTAYSKLSLPSTTSVTFNNKQTLDVAITWDESTYDSSKVGTQQVRGILETENFPYGYLPTEDPMVVTCNLTLTKAKVSKIEDAGDSSDPSNIVPPTDDRVFDEGSQTGNKFLHKVLYNTPSTSITLPKEVKLTLDAQDEVGNSTITVPITFDMTTYDNIDRKVLGEHIYRANVDTSVYPSIDYEALRDVNLSITVMETDAISTEILPIINKPTYTSIDNLGLPNTVKTLFSNGEYEDILITWNTDNYNKESLSPQIIQGTLNMPYAHTNTQGLKVTQIVTLSEAQIASIELQTIQSTFNLPAEQLKPPTEVTVTLNSTTSDASTELVLPVTYDLTPYDKYSMTTQHLMGTIDMSAYVINNSGNIVPKLDVVMSPTEVVQILTDRLKLTVPYGTTFKEIPQLQDSATKISVKLDNNTIFGDEESEVLYTKFKESDYKYNALAQTIQGKLSLFDGILNPNNLTYPVDIVMDYTTYKDIISSPKLKVIKVAKGTSLDKVDLPQSVQLELSNGEFAEAKVLNYDPTNYNPNDVGTYDIPLTLTYDESITNTRNYPFIQQLEVVDVTNGLVYVEPVQPIIIDNSLSINLPTTTKGYLTDGSTVDVPITWDTSNVPDKLVPGVYLVPGEINYPNPLDLTITQEIDIVDLYATDIYIAYVQAPPTGRGLLGTPYEYLGLGNTQRVRLSDNRWVDIDVGIDTTRYDKYSLEYQVLPGAFSNTIDFTNKFNLKPYQCIQLREAEDDEQANKDGAINGKIISFTNPHTIYVKYNTKLQDIAIPKSIPVLLDNGTTVNMKVEWDFTGYKPDYVGAEVFKGKFTQIGAVPIISNEDPQLTIYILPNPEDRYGDKTIVDISPIEPITNTQGKLLPYKDLPQEVEVTLRNGNKIKYPAKWDYISKILNLDTTIEGQLDLTDMFITCPNILNLDVKVYKTSDDGQSNQPIPNKKEEGMKDTNSTQYKHVPKSETTTNPPTDEGLQEPAQQSGGETLQTQDMVPEEEIEADKKVLNAALNQVPYTLAPDTVINWSSIIKDKDYITISPNKFTKDTISEIKLRSKFAIWTVKSQIYVLDPYTVEFTDVPTSYWAHDSIAELSKRGYSRGTSATEYKPKQNIAVSDTFTFLDRILVNNGKIQMLNTRSYVDNLLDSKTHWSYYSVASILSKLNPTVVSTLPKVTSYDQELTREEVAIILYDLLNQYGYQAKSSNAASIYKDLNDIHDVKSVSYCTDLGLFKGDNLNNFNPSQKITRAELVAVLIRFDNLLLDK